MTGADGGPTHVLALVGTDFHPFNRLVEWIEDWAMTCRPGQVELLIQYGTSAPPRSCAGQAYLAQDELSAALDRADVVVCHGGPATITEARAAGHLPICVPRDDSRAEHVDGHQLRFARRIGRDGLIVLAERQADFVRALNVGLSTPSSLSIDARPSNEGSLLPAASRAGRLVHDLLAQASPGPRRSPRGRS